MAGMLAAMALVLGLSRPLQAEVRHAAAAVSPPSATDDAQIGTLEAVSGPVKIERDGAPVLVASGDAVVAGDTVLTAESGRVVLRLGASIQVRLGADTRFRIDQFTPAGEGTFTFDGGAMLYTRSARDPQPRVSLAVPFGEVTGRAARLFVGRVDGQYGVALMRGHVKVAAGGSAVNLEPGDAADIPRKGPPTPELQPWSEARIRQALALVE